MKIVEVIWVDSNIWRGWQRWNKLEDYHERQSLQCKTAGYLFKETKEKVTLLMSRAWEHADDEEPSSGAELMTIPRVAIEDIRELK